MRRKVLLFSVLLITATLLSSCSLLPEEEPIRTAPLLNDYQREVYKTAVVERGDLKAIEKVTCKYVPVQSASLGFALGGEYVDKMMVQLGDTVEEGQLLGQLKLGTLEEDILKAENSIAELELRKAYIEELYQIELRRFELTGKNMDTETRREAMEDLEKDFATRRKDVNEAIELQTMTLDALKKMLEERQIRAPFAGTVTYVRKYEDGDLSTFGENSVKIADSTMSLFRAETKYWDRFNVGDTHEIVVSKNPYNIIVTDEAALGLPVPEKVPGSHAYVYFMLEEANFTLSEGDYGTLDLIRDQRLDVLHVPSSAILNAGDKRLVYYEREDGMKAYKEVETGITVNRRTEIISGLNEGDIIIVD